MKETRLDLVNYPYVATEALVVGDRVMFTKNFLMYLAVLVFFVLCTNAHAAGKYYKKIDKCILVYSGDIATGSAYLNLKSINEIIPKSKGIQFIFGKNSTTIYAEKKQLKAAVEAFIRCSQ
ncbi:MAG TPA: hypothetical protein EYP35_04495 [Desulfobacterales bacterium]|nr:hypothetical protein [Desulfobacterales bacterium]